MLRSWCLSFLLFSGAFQQVFADGQRLQYQVGEVTVFAITQKFDANYNKLGKFLSERFVGTIHLEVTLLSEIKRGIPVDVEVIVRDIRDLYTMVVR